MSKMLAFLPQLVNINDATSMVVAVAVFFVLCIAIIVLLMIRTYVVQRRNLKKISDIAYVDELTQSPTLAKFKLEAQRFIDDNLGKKLLMVKFDIEKFKLINESLGKDVGDRVLINMTKALKQNTAGEYERYAHLHDDEFLVLHIYEDPKEVLEVRDLFKEIFSNLMGDDFNYTFKIISGHYYMHTENCIDVTEAIDKANIAHSKAKEMGHEIVIYDKNFIKDALKRKNIENKMKKALANGEMKVYLQAQYLLEDETIAGAEALVRWIKDDGSIEYPNDFIPVFEQNGFITQLDLYMFTQVCIIIRGWIDSGVKPVAISINFSRLHLENSGFVNILCSIADEYNIPHDLLVVEITETIMFNNEETLLAVLEQLHSHGFTLAMDDFGTGYSSLGLLKNIPIDVIKIDKSFFEKSDNQMRSEIVLLNVTRLAGDLKIQTVAEGVETIENVNVLKRLGCDVVQGYYYAKPIPADELASHLLRE